MNLVYWASQSSGQMRDGRSRQKLLAQNLLHTACRMSLPLLVVCACLRWWHVLHCCNAAMPCSFMKSISPGNLKPENLSHHTAAREVLVLQSSHHAARAGCMFVRKSRSNLPATYWFHSLHAIQSQANYVAQMPYCGCRMFCKVLLALLGCSFKLLC